MLENDVYYYEEKKYAGNRLTVLFAVSLLAILVSSQTTGMMHSNARMIQIIIAALLIASIFHFIVISKKPYFLVRFRKVAVLVLDLVALTLVVGILGHTGIFFLPIFVIIVMQIGLSLGMDYFYLSVLFSAMSFILLVTYVEYWQMNSDIIIAFALTTFLVPMFYLNDLMRIHTQNDILNEELSSSEYEASYDSLTGVANRKTYLENMREVMSKKRPFALIFIDLNKFKVINDTHGHHVGDEVLIEVSKRLQYAIGDNDFLSRLGGDEFVIVTHREKTFLLKFLKHLEQQVIGNHHVDGLNIFINLSMGVSIYPDDAVTAKKLSKYADKAMYEAKKRSDTSHIFYRDLK
jgi:diguanylate cyclase (GGDEF)-like protein